jgi:hypothetical protein
MNRIQLLHEAIQQRGRASRSDAEKTEADGIHPSAFLFREDTVLVRYFSPQQGETDQTASN